MNILFWMSSGFDRFSPSRHLMAAVAEALCQREHHVHILQKDTGGSLPSLPVSLNKLNVSSTCIKMPLPRKENLPKRFLTDIQYILRCKKWLKRQKAFDRVFLQSSNVIGIQMYLLKKWNPSLPVTCNVQDIFPQNALYIGAIRPGIFYKALSAMQSYAYHHAAHIITISEDMQEELVSLGVEKEKIQVVYNWSYQDAPYDTKTLNYTNVASYFEKDTFQVVYAGNIGRMQAVDVVLQAAAHLQGHSDIAFHIFGDGVHLKKLMELAQKMQLSSVQFHPLPEESDAPSLYSAADVNIIPLAKHIYRTALPSKTATCLACGKPVLFCLGEESRFAKRICSQGNGWLLPAEDGKKLAEAILHIKCGAWQKENALPYTSLFSQTENSRQYARIIES